MISLADREIRIAPDWTEGPCPDCGSTNLDSEVIGDGVRRRCNICGLRGKTTPE